MSAKPYNPMVHVVKQKQLKNKTASNKRNRNKNNNNKSLKPYSTGPVAAVSAGASTDGGLLKRARPHNILREIAGKVTPEGMSFLKCAFAPPDFAATSVKGVPDDFQGRSLTKKHRAVGDLLLTTANTDYYILLLPIPGYSYWQATVPSGTAITASTVFYGIPYADNSSLFGNGGFNTAEVVNRFRFVSNHIEIIPTVNQMTWTGTIRSFKFPLNLIMRQNPSAVGVPTSDLLATTGLNSLNARNADSYSGSFNMGVYAAAYNIGNGFDFKSVIENATSVPVALVGGDFGILSTTFGGLNYSFPGVDNDFESVCIAITGMGTNVLNTAIIKTWACVEYQVLPGTSIYEYSSLSCRDPNALRYYRQIINELPVAVCYMDNEGFWNRVLGIIRRISGVASVLPGPYGRMAGGINATAEALEQLFL